jgi:hypothetical protein
MASHVDTIILFSRTVPHMFLQINDFLFLFLFLTLSCCVDLIKIQN